MSNLDSILVFAVLALQAPLAGILIRGRHYRRFPFFFSYTVYSVIVTIARALVMHRSPVVYFFLYWSTEAPYMLLGLAAMHEGYKVVFRPFYEIRWFRFLLPAVLLATFTIAYVHFLFHPPVRASLMWRAILVLDITVRNLQAGIFVLSFAFARLLGIRPQRQGAAILDGFGIAALGILLAGTLEASQGENFRLFFRFAPSFTYIIAVLIWLLWFWKPATGGDKIRQEMTMGEMIGEFERYQKIVKRL